MLPSFQTLENSERKKLFYVFHTHCASLILRYIYYPKANIQKLRLAHNYLKLPGWLNRQLTLYEAHPNLHFWFDGSTPWGLPCPLLSSLLLEKKGKDFKCWSFGSNSCEPSSHPWKKSKKDLHPYLAHELFFRNYI